MTHITITNHLICDYKYNNNGQDFSFYTVNYCYKHSFTGNHHIDQEKRTLSQSTCRRKQAYAQKGHQMRTVPRQGCTQGEPHESKGEQITQRTTEP